MLSRKEKNELKKQIGELLKRLGEDVSRKEKNEDPNAKLLSKYHLREKFCLLGALLGKEGEGALGVVPAYAVNAAAFLPAMRPKVMHSAMLVPP